jgi:hypothetical protein
VELSQSSSSPAGGDLQALGGEGFQRKAAYLFEYLFTCNLNRLFSNLHLLDCMWVDWFYWIIYLFIQMSFLWTLFLTLCIEEVEFMAFMAMAYMDINYLCLCRDHISTWV